MRAPVRPVAVDVTGLELELLPAADGPLAALAVAVGEGGYVLAPGDAYLALHGAAIVWHVPIVARARQVGVK